MRFAPPHQCLISVLMREDHPHFLEVRLVDKSNVQPDDVSRRVAPPVEHSGHMVSLMLNFSVHLCSPHLPPTWMIGRCSRSGSASLKTSWVTGAVSPSPKRM